MSASKNLGKVFMTPKGIWDKTLNYTKLDIVTNKVGKISCGYIATTDIEKNVEITDNRWLKLFELLDGDLTEEYKAVQTDVTNKATDVDANKKAVDLIYSQMQKLYDVEISTTTPTNERTGLWINPDDISGVINIPEIKDDEVSDVDTWSSKKIDNVTGSLKGDLVDISDLSVNKTVTEYIVGKYINSNQEIGSEVLITNLTTDSTRVCLVMSVSQGMILRINGSGGNSPRAWAFLDINNNVISKSEAHAICTNTILKAPNGARRIVLNALLTDNYKCEILYNISETVEEIESDTSKISRACGMVETLEFVNGSINDGKLITTLYYQYRIVTPEYTKFSHDVKITANDGFFFILEYKDENGILTDEYGNKVYSTGNLTNYTIRKDTEFRIVIRKSDETAIGFSSSIANINEFKKGILSNNIIDTIFDDIKATNNYIDIAKSGHTKRLPSVTFISDDGAVDDYTKLKPLAEKYNIPFCTAVVTGLIGSSTSDMNYMTSEQLVELCNSSHGWEMLCHTHTNVKLTKLSDNQIRNECRESIKTLKNLGIECNGIVYVEGRSDANVRRVVSEFFKFGVSVQDDKYTVNRGCIGNYFIIRCNLGSFFDPQRDGYSATNTLEYYKELVDECISKNAWLVFEMHTWHNDFNETQQHYVDELIAYIKEHNVQIVTASDGFEMFGNQLQSGDYLGVRNGESLDGYGFAINKEGEFAYGSQSSGHDLNKRNVLNSTPISEFRLNYTTIFPVTNNDGTNHGFPTSYGLLKTYRYDDYDLSYQTWIDVNNGVFYFRKATSDSTWSEWNIVSLVN